MNAPTPSSLVPSVAAHDTPAPIPAAGVSRRRGFTLIELMVVIVILGMLIVLVGPNVMKALSDSSRGTANAQMSNFAGAIKLYYLDKRSLPQSLDELTQSDANGNAYIEKIPNDPWGQPYDYKIVDARKQKYELVSSGEDKQMGTDDDVYFPPRDSK
jgi:general secretion pathway protein G